MQGRLELLGYVKMYRKRMRVRDFRKISSDRRESSRSPREIVVEEELEWKSDAVDDEKTNLAQCNTGEQGWIGKLKQLLFYLLLLLGAAQELSVFFWQEQSGRRNEDTVKHELQPICVLP